MEEDDALIQSLTAKGDAVIRKTRVPNQGHWTARNTPMVLLESGAISREKLLWMARSARVVVLEGVSGLMERFLGIKLRLGSSKEKTLYRGMSTVSLARRLLMNRPAAFLGRYDQHVTLPDGVRLSQEKHWYKEFMKIGTDQETHPLVLADFMSYDEMALSALIGAASHTVFFNDGNRMNMGRPGPAGSFVPEGVIVGLVGTRLELPGLMEFVTVMANQEQNTEKNGFGEGRGGTEERIAINAMWADFYGYPDAKLPTFEEAVSQGDVYVWTGRGFLHKKMWQFRTSLSLASRGREAGRKAYGHVVGLGLGAWLVHPLQLPLFVEALLESYKSLPQMDRDWIDTVDISYLVNLHRLTDDDVATMQSLQSLIDAGGAEGTVILSFNEPQSSLKRTWRQQLHMAPGEERRVLGPGVLLVVMYAWDANAWPGNEYYNGQWAGSSDPAAACSTLLPYLHNPRINTDISYYPQHRHYVQFRCHVEAAASLRGRGAD